MGEVAQDTVRDREDEIIADFISHSKASNASRDHVSVSRGDISYTNNMRPPRNSNPNNLSTSNLNPLNISGAYSSTGGNLFGYSRDSTTFRVLIKSAPEPHL